MTGLAFSISNFLPKYEGLNLVLCKSGGGGLGTSLPQEVDLYANFQVDTWNQPYWAYIQYDIRQGGCGSSNMYFGQVQINLDNTTKQLPALPVKYVGNGSQVALQNMRIVRQGDEGGYWYKLEADLPAPPNPSRYANVPFRGINLAGGDFAPPPVLPAPSDVTYFVKQGMNTARVPLKWEYLQPDLAKNIDWSAGYPKEAAALIDQLMAWNVTVIVDLHNYMRYDASDPSSDSKGNDFIIGSGNAGAPTANQYASLWSQLAGKFIQKNQVMFDLMNEPFNMDTQLVLDNYNTAIAAIRQAEAAAGVVSPHLLLLEGNSWSGLHSWSSPQTGGSNASVFVPANIKDPKNDYAINVHQYFDSDFSGTTSACIAPNTVLNQINWSSFVNWVTTHKVAVMVTEFGTGGSPTCGQDIQTFLSEIGKVPYQSGGGGFLGWTAWSGGSFDSNYILSLNPGGPANPLIGTVYSQFLTKPPAGGAGKNPSTPNASR